MVKNEKQHIEKTRAKQGFPADSPEPYKIVASTPFDFGAKNLTPYGGLFPVSTMLEKLGFKRSEEHTSELQSQSNLVCRLLLEKKKQLSTTERPRIQPIKIFVIVHLPLLPPEMLHLPFTSSRHVSCVARIYSSRIQWYRTRTCR